jgi:hypothetical protein
MIYNPDFDVDAVMRTVGTVGTNYPEGSPEDEALRIVSVALLYIRDSQRLEEYREYFRKFFLHKPVSIARVFSTREEAEQWLASGSAKDGDLVKVAGQAFVVLNALKGLRFVPTRIPEDLEPSGVK